MIPIGFSLFDSKAFHDFASQQKYIEKNPTQAWLRTNAYMLQFLSPNVSRIEFLYYKKFSFSEDQNQSLLSDLANEKIITTVFNLAVTEERQMQISFSTPHRANDYCFFTKRVEKYAEQSWTDAFPIPIQICAFFFLVWICLQFLTMIKFKNFAAKTVLICLKIFLEASALQFYSATLKANSLSAKPVYLFRTVEELTNLLNDGKLHMVAYDTSIVEFELLNNTKRREYAEFRNAIFALKSTQIRKNFPDICNVLRWWLQELKFFYLLKFGYFIFPFTSATILKSQ